MGRDTFWSREEVSSPGKRTERLSAAIAPPKAPGGDAKWRQPEQKAWAGFHEKKNQRQETFERIAKAIDGGVAELDQHRRGGGVELGLVLLSQLQVDSGKLDAVLQIFLLGLHLLDFAAHAGDLLLHVENIFDLARSRSKNVLETKLRLAVILDASNKVGVLLGDFFAVLHFILDAS